MDAWIAELKKIATLLVRRDSPMEMWGLVAICALLLWVVYPRLSIRLGGRGKLAVLSLVPGILLLLSAAAVAAFAGLHPVMQAVAAVLALLLLVLPLTILFERISYFEAFLLWGMCLTLIAGLLVAETQLKTVIDRSVEKSSEIRESRDKTNRYWR